MKKLALLLLSGTLMLSTVASADPLTPLQVLVKKAKAQQRVFAKGTAAMGSRIIAYMVKVHDGATYVNTDTLHLVYSGTRGGDLTHTPLKYDNAQQWTWNTTTSSWDNKYKYSQTFDANNNPTDMIEMKWNTVTSAWENYFHYIYMFDANNNMTSQIEQDWNTVTNTWDNAYKYTYTYDANHNRLTYIQQNWNTVTSTWDNGYKYTYTYNAANKVTQETDFLWNTATSTWDNWYKYTYTYDANNNLLTELTQVWNTTTSTWDNNSLETSTYSVSNQNLTTISQTWNTSTSSWDNDERTIHADFTGINPGTDTIQQWNNSASTWDNKTRYKYTYNSYDQWVTYLEDTWNVGGFWQGASGDYSYHIYYEEYATNVKSLSAVGGSADVYPMPATDKLNIDLTWNEAQPFTVSIVDLQGRVSRTWQAASATSYHQAISVGELPAGTYFLKIEGTKGHIVKQLVVAPK